LKKVFGDNVALIREGGSIPIVQAFKDVLKADTLLLGLALPDCQAHAPNENFPIANLEAGMRLNQALLAELAERKGPPPEGGQPGRPPGGPQQGGGDPGARLAEFIKRADADADGKISKDEFAGMGRKESEERFSRDGRQQRRLRRSGRDRQDLANDAPWC
jgi:hypothetical protein